MADLFGTEGNASMGVRLLLESETTRDGRHAFVAVVTYPPGRAVRRVGVGLTVAEAISEVSAQDERYRLDAYDVNKTDVRTVLSGHRLGYSWMCGEPGTNGETLERFRDDLRPTIRAVPVYADATEALQAWAVLYAPSNSG